MVYDSDMSGNTEMTGVDEQVTATVQRVLSDRLERFGFEGVVVCPGEDHDGDPVLFIDVQYRLSDEPIDATATFELVRALRVALRAVGETRFPHLRHHFDDRQQVARSS